MPASVNNSGVPQIRSSLGRSGLHRFLPAPVWNLLAVLTRSNTCVCVWPDTQLPGDAVVYAWTALCRGGLHSLELWDGPSVFSDPSTIQVFEQLCHLKEP